MIEISKFQFRNAVSFLYIAFGVLMLFASAQLTIDTRPVPITLQTMSVMLIGLLYSKRHAISSIISYIILGLVGLPIFSSYGYGVAKLLGPSGGYILGMLFAIVFLSYTKGLISLLWRLVIANFIIYICGMSYLSLFIGFEEAVYHGSIVFIPSGIIKSLALYLVIKFIRSENYER